MRRIPPWALLLPLLMAAAPRTAPAAPPAPALEAARDGITLSRLPPILGEEEVRKQLATGLTTSFAFEATARASGGKLKGAARVDVRYDLWDEIYIVTRVDASGHAARVTLPSFEKLAEWWRDARLVLIRGPAAGAAAADVRLKVIPFSQAEQLETQRWFSQALSAEKSGSAGAVSDAVEDQPESFSQVINLLMATSIGRPALLEYAWKLPVPQGKKR
ncbi:MAG TPA: hypothetical protein VFR03_13650 [Thermoanaerobaculia bacterium]|nr:hypothetical protein [Thermoanaerobaculia bacterium]